MNKLIVLLLLISFSSAFGQINVEEHGLMFFDDSNVGIGLNNPSRALHLQSPNAVFRMDRDRPSPGFLMTQWSTNFGEIYKSFFITMTASGPNNGEFLIGDYGTNVGGGFITRFAINNNGDVGIGTRNPITPLTVNGRITSEEIQVVQNVADYVFYPDYKLMSLKELENFIKSNGHLPNLLNQNDVNSNSGYTNLGKLTVGLMEKVEELTLYIIQLNNIQEELIKKIENLENKLINYDK